MTTCPTVLCSHSIAHRLSKKLAIFTAIVIGLVSTASWFSVATMVKQRNLQDLGVRCDLLADILSLEAQNGGETAVLQRLNNDAPMRARTRLEVWRSDGRLLYADPLPEVLVDSAHARAHDFSIDAPGLPGGKLQARYSVDFTRSAELGVRWAVILILVTLSAGVVVALGAGWFVRRSLRPLNLLAAQTRAISPQLLHQRLALTDPAEELSPWIEQFNALMARLQQAYGQLEAFNADVAHELRTPLATLIGETEVALSRERSPEALRETLQSNLEEMQRLSALVNDMLFLSQADRGVTARRGAPVSLAGLAAQVSEFHEATLEDAGLQLRIEGDATLPVDEPLVKRALSNLLGNATRFATPGSTVVIAIAPGPEAQQVQVVVQNRGTAIAADHLPRLFDRFFRVDSARSCDDAQHHGLGLAIVAAIARMHAGRTLAESTSGTTRVGFTLAS
jgi:two-component system, OmpR family, heavy metal sensor histidine kinase CusS